MNMKLLLVLLVATAVTINAENEVTSEEYQAENYEDLPGVSDIDNLYKEKDEGEAVYPDENSMQTLDYNADTNDYYEPIQQSDYNEEVSDEAEPDGNSEKEKRFFSLRFGGHRRPRKRRPRHRPRPKPVSLKPPVVTVEAAEKRIRFKCQFFPNPEYPMYEVRWFTASRDFKKQRIIKKVIVTSGDVSFLENTDKEQEFKMGTYIFAKLRGLKDRQGRRGSNIFTSNKYFAGFEISPSNKVHVSQNGKPTELKIIQTVPILCKDGSTNCQVYVRLTHSKTIMLSQCTLVFKATSEVMVSQTITVVVKQDFIVGRTVNGFISLDIHISEGTEGIDWDEPNRVVISVSTTSQSSGQCSSTGDPHFRTFDGLKYDHFKLGDYTLVQSKVRKFTVQARTTRCKKVACNCGVAVREGDDVLVVDMCKGDFNPRARYASKQQPQHGTYIERNANGKTFILHFKSGATVHFKARRWFGRTYYADINVELPGTDYGNTLGLCGTLDRNRRNEMIAKNGKTFPRLCRGRQACTGFTESWKLTVKESLFAYNGGSATCLPKGTGSSYCQCTPGGYPFRKDSCGTEVDPPDFRNKKGYKILYHPIIKKCKQEKPTTPGGGTGIVITLRPTGTGDIYPWKPPQITGPLPTFPLPDGTTKRQTILYCTRKIKRTTIYAFCARRIRRFNIAQFVDNCVTDTMLTGKMLPSALSALNAMTDHCTSIVTTNPIYWVTINGVKVPPKITEAVCDNQCSGNGICKKGQCECNVGYTSDDCSMKVGVIPSITYPTGDLCDVRTEDCSMITLHVTDLNTATVVVGYHNILKKFISLGVEVVSFMEIYVLLRKIVHIKYNVLIPGISHYTYQLIISNDGKTFSKPKPCIVYDSKCMSCDIGKGCTLKPNTCQIRGYCFTAGEKDPNDPCLVCDPSRSTKAFVDVVGSGGEDGALLKSVKTKQAVCNETAAEENCMVPPETGKCKANMLRYYYNAELQECKKFVYGGCGGNGNKFASLETCTAKCVKGKSVCDMPLSVGCCNQVVKSYYYNAQLKKCREFTFSGCGGNGNRFKSMKACNTKCTKAPPPAAKPKPECKAVADIGFVVDSSGSLGSHYQDEKDFLKGLAGAFGISKDGSHSGVVTFSLTAALNIKLNQYMDQASFDKAVDDIPHLNAFTRIDLGLELARDELFNAKNGARPNIPKLLVLITDGTQTSMPGSKDPSPIAAGIRKSGIDMIAIGIGSEVNKDELDKIAGDAKDAYTAKDFSELLSEEFVSKITKAACKKEKSK